MTTSSVRSGIEYVSFGVQLAISLLWKCLQCRGTFPRPPSLSSLCLPNRLELLRFCELTRDSDEHFNADLEVPGKLQAHVTLAQQNHAQEDLLSDPGTLEGRGLGENAVDVFLNDGAFWRCVPSGVWTYTLGGYQVIKKWLSYREHGVLGRALTVEEAREVTGMARRIAAILLLEPSLDENFLTAQR